jgi:plasmid stabilization system protein ParE
VDPRSRALAERDPQLYRSRQSHRGGEDGAGIYEKAQVLATFPEVGYRYRGSTSRPIRILLYGHYRIAYLVEEEGAITILGVFHGALDIERYLS